MRRSGIVVLSVLMVGLLMVLAACSSPNAGRTLWIAEKGVGIHGYTAAQRTSSGSPTPAVTLSSTDWPEGLALDVHGDLWVGMTRTQSLVEFTPSQQVSTATPTPAVTIGSDGTSLRDPVSLAFDAQGNLWVANAGSGTDIEMYTSSQLASSGNQSPSVSITGSYNGILGLAFDANGDLWFSDGGNNQIVELTPSELAGSGSPPPHVTVNSSVLNNPVGLAFDANHNLWVANFGSGTNPLLMFTAADISAGGTPAATVVISDDGSGNLSGPLNLAFNSQGDLWESGYGGSGGQDLVKFAAADIAKTGHPTAAVVLSGFTGFNFPQIGFGPALAQP